MTLNTSTSLIDTHCHVDLYPSPGRIIADAEAAKIYTIAVTNAPSVFFHTQALCAGNRYVRPAVGLHPELVRTHGTEVDMLWPLLDQTRYVGEVGLDYTTSNAEDRQRQRQVFEQILSRCAAAGNKVLTIHSRRAASDVIAAVGHGFPGAAILHWFSGSAKQADAAAANGFYFSVNPAMVRSAAGQKLIVRFPRDRILTETDGPFVIIEDQPARPQDAAIAIRFLAESWGVSEDDARRKVLTNFRTLLGVSHTDALPGLPHFPES